MKTIDTVGYVRVSSRGQVSGSGIDRQKRTIRQYSRDNGFTIREWYSDAHTGTDVDRPAFMEMIKNMNGISTIIIESLDRLARDVMVQSLLLSRLEDLGVNLISASTGENITVSFKGDPMRKAMVQIQGVFAELEKNLLVRKLRKAREMKREKYGKCEGRKKYGEKIGEDKIVTRIKKLRRIRKMGKKLSYKAIADSMNAEGLMMTRTGGRWHATQVRRILVGKSAG